jgi:hypothetical protein
MKLAGPAKSIALSIFAVILFGTASYATTGADFLQLSEEWGNGFTWGVVEGNVSIVADDPTDVRLAEHRRKCINDSHIYSSTMYQAVRTHIQSHPSELTQSAAGAVLTVLFEMCGPPSDTK